MTSKNEKGILVYLELDGMEVSQLSLELLNKANELASLTGEKVYGILTQKEGSRIESKMTKLPATKVFIYYMPTEFEVKTYEKGLIDCIGKLNPSIVLAGGTMKGRAIISRVATQFRSGVTADCTGLAFDKEGNLIQTRPAFGGNVIADIITPDKRPQFATVRKGVFEAIAYRNEAVCMLEEHVMKQDENEAPVLMKIDSIKESVGIESAKVLIVVGRGVKRKEDIEMLSELAKKLGGEIACSRAIVDQGWLSKAYQIGLSGKTVSPELVITCGVSGSVQFLSGLRRARCIIAINEDEQANIFQVAHHGIVGDLYDIIPQIIERGGR